jgi:16S rRNA (adenine1518-N6/adenine1519-N6)-dimethyltransferase
LKKSFKHKKSLGQHFLNNPIICQKIVDSIPSNIISNVLEIGPGEGALTKFLVKKQYQLFCIDVDDRIAQLIPNQFPSVKFIHQNFLTLDFQEYWKEPFFIIGNFPYNISTEIIFKILDNKDLVNGVVGMFQKEVAMRFAAKHGNKTYGVTSILTQCFFDITYLFDVGSQEFTPPPKVESGVILLTPVSKPYEILNPKLFKQLVKAGFNQRRKTLRNALGAFNVKHVDIQHWMHLRAEQLSIAEWVALANNLSNLA